MATPQRVVMPQVLHKLSQPPTKAWQRILTLDLLIYVANRSIFHPAIVLIAWLCLAAVPPLHHRHPAALPLIYYATLLFAIRFLADVNHRIANGKSRKVNWDEEVVVVTGGATGLGRCMVELILLSKPGSKVAVIDIREADEEAREWLSGKVPAVEGRLWWGCIDIRNAGAVRIMAGRIKEELGRPTMLINNAAATVVGMPLLPNDRSATLTPQEATKTLTVNTLSHFNTLSAFLPELLSSKAGCTIVTISSLLAHLSPTRLADYSASKAALSSLHATLTHEIRNHPETEVQERCKTVLVEPGMIGTELFRDITEVPWYSNFFGPLLEVNEVAKAIVAKLDKGESGTIRMPFYSKCMPFYAAMPGAMQKGMRWFAGIDAAIVPRRKKQA
ncbi:hypothetical protein BT93_L4761 [Corymbia citriodora subsp. variegata]|uniref:Uncharacterized protein n=1 Tax=Corymbia citriodora subsp. variegata TaxID=360336 RepID=A0A8T0CKF8_CORYI|nr:hypothetical protein BT93_L4761 [Corymbia citriodora subsp. variegata]